jgi:hypothetical protein
MFRPDPEGVPVPELQQHDPTPPPGAARESKLGVDERAARGSLRRQITRLERDLAALFAETAPRAGIEWRVGAAGGPRMLGIAELERTRDALAHRLAEARAEIGRRAEREEASRALVERMIADPAGHRWVRVRGEDVGERSCKHWHSRPRWGLLGMIAGWWRVKLSSGCPLASGAC